MITLLVKVTVLFLAGLIALKATKRATASMRHLLCGCTLAGALMLFLVALVTSKTMAFHLATVDSAVARSQALTRTVAWPSSAVLLWLWALGAALMLIRLGIGYWRIGRVHRTAAVIESGLYAADVTVPIACGIVKPVILLPR